MPDRHLGARLPHIKLAHLPGSIDSPLKRPDRPREQRPHLPQIVIHDRLARRAPQRLQQFPDPHPGQLRVFGQQPMDLRLELLQHARPRRSLISRRGLASQRSADRVLRQPRLARQALDRLARDEMLASQLGPLLHLDHPSRRPFSSLTRRALTAPRTTPPTRPRGSVFKRRRGVSFHPAPTRTSRELMASCASNRPPSVCSRASAFLVPRTVPGLRCWLWSIGDLVRGWHP